MKNLTKKTFAKLFATFLGASTILTPLATVISCTQTKTPIEQKQIEPTPQPTPNPPAPGPNPPQPGPNPPAPGPNPPQPGPNPPAPGPNPPQPGPNPPAPGPNPPQPGPNPPAPGPNPPQPGPNPPAPGPGQDETTTEEDTTSVPGATITTTTDNAGKKTVNAKGTITLEQIAKLAEKGSDNSTVDTKELIIQSFKSENDTYKILPINEDDLKKAAKFLSSLNIKNIDDSIQTITLDKKTADITSISGNISLKDINEDTKSMAHYIANKLKTKPDFDVSELKVNTFYKTPKGKNVIKPQNITSENIEWEYVSTPITPSFLKGTDLGALNKASLNFKDGDKNIPVSFQSTETDYFDVNEFYKAVNSGKLSILKDNNLIVNSDKSNNIQIVLRDLQEKKFDGSDFDITPYIKSDNLLKLIENEKLKDALVIGDMYVTGNVKNLLPHLVGTNKVEEVNNGIKFLNLQNFKCPGNNVTEYNGGSNNTTALPVEQLIEFRKRTDIRRAPIVGKNVPSVNITNLLLENVDTTKMSEDDVKFLNFTNDDLAENITFKNSNLSKIQMILRSGGLATVTFEETTLPFAITKDTQISTLILKNVTIPKEAIIEDTEGDMTDLAVMVPIIGKLEIYGNIKNSILKDLSEQDIKKLQKAREVKMPNFYKGPEDVYKRLKYIYYGESTNPEFGNFTMTSLNKKPQSPFLLALLEGKTDHTRG